MQYSMPEHNGEISVLIRLFSFNEMFPACLLRLVNSKASFYTLTQLRKKCVIFSVMTFCLFIIFVLYLFNIFKTFREKCMYHCDEANQIIVP